MKLTDIPERQVVPPFVGVVTYNPMATLRFDLLDGCVRSIERAFPTSELFLLDNGSSDGSQAAVQELLGPEGPRCEECRANRRGRWHVNAAPASSHPEGNTTPGAGRHRLYFFMFEHTDAGNAISPFWAWSDDDMLWKEGAEDKLRSFWASAPMGIGLVSGLLEPVWHWNTPRKTVEYGGVRVLLRDSAPGAAWTFRERHNLPLLGEPEYACFGYDFKVCLMLAEHKVSVGQIDLADHAGWGRSTHGNDADQHVDGRPLDRKKWGV